MSDAFCPWNAGRWRVSQTASSASSGAGPRLDVSALGSVYLGGFSFASLERSQRVKEFTNAAIPLADRLFGTSRDPWCPEIF